jgi:hypothetical protein
LQYHSRRDNLTRPTIRLFYDGSLTSDCQVATGQRPPCRASQSPSTIFRPVDSVVGCSSRGALQARDAQQQDPLFPSPSALANQYQPLATVQGSSIGCDAGPPVSIPIRPSFSRFSPKSPTWRRYPALIRLAPLAAHRRCGPLFQSFRGSQNTLATGRPRPFSSFRPCPCSAAHQDAVMSRLDGSDPVHRSHLAVQRPASPTFPHTRSHRYRDGLRQPPCPAHHGRPAQASRVVPPWAARLKRDTIGLAGRPHPSPSGNSIRRLFWPSSLRPSTPPHARGPRGGSEFSTAN